MSNSLVRKSLELLGYEDLKQGKKKKRERSKGALDLIPANHRVISKRNKSDRSIVLSRSSKITVEEAKKQLNAKIDSTDENVRRLLLLSNNRIKSDTTDKLLKRALRKQYVPKEKKPAESEQTAFTEADFKRFEQEYVDQ